MYYLFSKVLSDAKGDISHWRPLTGQRFTPPSLLVISDIFLQSCLLTEVEMYQEKASVHCLSTHVYMSSLDVLKLDVLLFCGHAGSIEDRRYLRHEILNREIEFNVIVTT